MANCSTSRGSMSNSTTSPLASRFRLWWKARSQRLPRRSTLSDAAVGEVAADLLRDAHAHMLGDLLRPPRMRRDLGDRLEDEVQVADRDALGEQQLSAPPAARNRRSATGRFRRAGACIPAPAGRAARACPCRTGAASGCCGSTSLTWVSITERLSTGVKPSRRTSAAKASGIHIAFMPKAGSRDRRRRARPAPARRR